MKKMLLVSLAAASLIASDTVMLEDILVESTINDVSSDQIKSADTAEALAENVPSITLIRRSGVANDILLRGQKRDNINVIVDGGKIYGACPNRMDPPTSHIITPNIDTISVIEGPYDVEHSGTLSGLVTVDTVKPETGIHGNMNVGFGSFNFRSIAATVTGGNDTVRALVGVSGQWSDQYKDGDGNTFADQIDNAIADGQAAPGNAYQPAYRDLAAYAKKSVLAKLFINPADHQELRLSYTGNRSDAVLYPNTAMDAQYDNSDLYNAEYIMKDLGAWSKELSAQYYYSYVDHPMWTRWRKAAATPMGTMTNHLTSTIQGATLKNTAALTNSVDLTIGVDGYLRNWDGFYEQNGTYKGPSINDADTRNIGLFAELQKQYANAAVKVGMRYDDSKITSGNPALRENTYQSVGANVFADYKVSGSLGFFGGLGTASRIPDARELYFQKGAAVIGTPDLDQTTIYEVDLGMKNTYDAFHLKTRVFYSKYTNYIYYDANKTSNNFVNIGATVYGFELSGTWFMSDHVYLDFQAAAQRGTKDEALENQTNTNLADIPPLSGNVALNWNYSRDNLVTAQVAAANKWINIDDQNGEQIIDGWAVLNLKVDHRFDRHFGMIVGVDNVFDETYAVSNTYKDLTLLSVDPTADVMLMNEPGRYVYANLSYQF